MMTYIRFNVFLAIGCCCVGSCFGQELTTAGSKPNIVFILADDLGYGDLSCYGQQKFQTPNIDRLAAEGMRFTQHYSGSTVCAPSRCCLMTGKHTGHATIRGNREIEPIGQAPISRQDITIAELLKQAGYATGVIGKWGLGFPGSEGDPLKQGFDFFYGYNCQRNAHHYYPPFLWRNEKKIALPGNKLHTGKHYSPDLMTREATKFIEQHRNQPFFLYLSFVSPHASLTAQEEDIQRFRGKFPEKPFIETSYHYRSTDEPLATYAAMITQLDRDIGQVVSELEQQGLSENTLVMFSSDNGPHEEGGADPEYFQSSGPFRGVKRDLYEGGIRIPMIARWPGSIKAGTMSEHICASWDVLPTLAEIAKIPPLKGIDGISFLPALEEKEMQPQHEFLYWEFPGQGGKQAVRAGKWKIISLQTKSQGVNRIELYDLELDPHERNNVGAKHPDVVVTMQSIMQESHTDPVIDN